MRLLADEHVPTAFMPALAGEGHDVAAVGSEVAFVFDNLSNISLDIFSDSFYFFFFIIEFFIVST